MSVFICDKARLPFSIYFLLDFMAHTRSIFKIFTSMNLRNGSFLKPFNKLAVRVLSGINTWLSPRVYIPDKTLLLVYYTIDTTRDERGKLCSKLCRQVKNQVYHMSSAS